jgi:hypothetical protein
MIRHKPQPPRPIRDAEERIPKPRIPIIRRATPLGPRDMIIQMDKDLLLRARRRNRIKHLQPCCLRRETRIVRQHLLQNGLSISCPKRSGERIRERRINALLEDLVNHLDRVGQSDHVHP